MQYLKILIMWIIATIRLLKYIGSKFLRELQVN